MVVDFHKNKYLERNFFVTLASLFFDERIWKESYIVNSVYFGRENKNYGEKNNIPADVIPVKTGILFLT